EKVWLITGCSTGFGRELASKVLESGNMAAVTARKTSDILDIVHPFPHTAIALTLDVTDPSQVNAAIRQTVDRFGKIDVLVNNAGIGYFGAIEESEEDEVRRMFEIN